MAPPIISLSTFCKTDSKRVILDEIFAPPITNAMGRTGSSKAFEKASGKKVAYKITPRRSGDIATCFADPSYAYETLGWKATRGVEEMCEDSWRWQSNNPDGYPKS